jgi:hypothetical protein
VNSVGVIHLGYLSLLCLVLCSSCADNDIAHFFTWGERVRKREKEKEKEKGRERERQASPTPMGVQCTSAQQRKVVPGGSDARSERCSARLPNNAR